MVYVYIVESVPAKIINLRLQFIVQDYSVIAYMLRNRFSTMKYLALNGRMNCMQIYHNNLITINYYIIYI